MRLSSRTVQHRAIEAREVERSSREQKDPSMCSAMNAGQNEITNCKSITLTNSNIQGLNGVP